MNNDNTNKRKEVEMLIDKAANADKSEDAMRFSQAACNAASAMRCIISAELATS